jgi:2-polyprenyl-6-methoxyphenol hydroxylase-like FAD-dependent oxidoreductase
MTRYEVLIAGAGPTGLVLALWLTHFGVRLRIVDKVAEPGTTSRALGIQARTLELYNQVGLAQKLVERGLKFTAANLWVRGRPIARVPFGDMGVGLSPYPYMLIFPQDEHERLLIARLGELGVAVERPLELVAFEERGDCIVAQLKHPDGIVERCEASYIAGCDGARSSVREALATGFPGGTYAHMFYVADIVGTGPVIDKELHVALDDAAFLAAFPMAGDGHARLIGTVKEDAANANKSLQWSDVSEVILQRLKVEIGKINWFSTYHVHHRVAANFRKGRAFLLGDAAHIHSPVGAQGLNTGLGDAVNLAWKLAAVCQQRAPARLLDTFEPERIAFADRLIATTDRAFKLVTSESARARWVRARAVPFLMPKLFSRQSIRRLMFRTLSQTSIEYRRSALSQGSAGEVHAGDRLPWIKLEGAGNLFDNYAPLCALDWQVHVYGNASPTLEALCNQRGVALHTFMWTDAMQYAGIAPNAAYLLRPDGYVGCADASAGGETLARYLDTWVLHARQAKPA